MIRSIGAISRGFDMTTTPPEYHYTRADEHDTIGFRRRLQGDISARCCAQPRRGHAVNTGRRRHDIYAARAAALKPPPRPLYIFEMMPRARCRYRWRGFIVYNVVIVAQMAVSRRAASHYRRSDAATMPSYHGDASRDSQDIILQ